MALQLTRRELLTATAGAAMTAGCGIQLREIAPSRVSILKVPTYDQTIYDTMRRLLVEHLGDVRGRSILLKPNLVEFEPGSSINTHPMLVHAAYEAFRAMGAASVRIAEGPGHRRNTLDLAEAAGYFQNRPGFEDHFVDLNLDEVTRVRPTAQFSRIKKLYLPNSALRRRLAGLHAKMKTHHWVGATLSMKNLFGVVPGGIYGWPKNVLHWAGIDESIADLHAPSRATSPSSTASSAWRATVPFRARPNTRACWWPAGSGGRGCHLLPHHGDRSHADPLPATGRPPRRGVADYRRSYPAIGESIQSVATPFELIPQFQKLRLENS
jgi:hypothetical protein